MLYIIFGIFITNVCYAGSDNYPLGARSAGMASTAVALTDIWASANNQAGLGFLEKPAAAIYYENRLNTEGLALQAGAFAIPIHSTVVGVNYRYYGFSKYNESKFGLAVAKKLGEQFAIGVQVNYFHAHIAGDYGNVGNLCGEIGLLYEPVKSLTIGAHLYNIWQSRQKVNLDKIPTIMRFGVAYKITDKATVGIETEKDLRMSAVFKGGLEYSLIEDLYLRCGVSTGNIYQYAFGLGYSWKWITLDVAFSHHKFLGYSPHISLGAKF